MTDRVRPIRFLIAWFVAAGLGLPLAPLLWLPFVALVALPFWRIPTLISAPIWVDEILSILVIMLFAFAHGWCIGALQKLVVKRFLGVELRRWRVVSALGGSLAGIAGMYFCQASCRADDLTHLWTQPSLRPADDLLLSMFVFLVTLSAAQFLVLRRQLPSAPLWIVGHVISVPMLYALWRNPLADQFPRVESWVVLVLGIHFVAALVSAAVMLRIVSLAMNRDKAKRKAKPQQAFRGAPSKLRSPLADDA